MLEKIQETATFLREKMHTSPETAIILGTGLGSLVHEITDKYEISYKDIPNFPVSTVEGHSGKLIFGKLGNKDISGVLSMMPKDAIYYFTRADVKRALPENELQALAQQVGLQGQSYPNVKAAVEAAKQHSSEKDFIFVGGSSFIVADLLKFHV